jgi:probable rRNA maturation factor
MPTKNNSKAARSRAGNVLQAGTAGKQAGKPISGQTGRKANTRAGSRPVLKLAVQYAVRSDLQPSRYDFRRWVKAALERDSEVALRVVDADEGRRLNRDYRRKDYATNVLTFAYGESAPGQPLLGDVVLCAPVVASEAQAQDKDLIAHYAHLTVHGVLHMQGYDHEKARDAKVMEAREVAILSALGFPDPYSA